MIHTQFSRSIRTISLIVLVSLAAACTTTSPLRINTAGELEPYQFESRSRYELVFNDGTKVTAQGKAIRMQGSSVYVYSYDEGIWNRYDRSELVDVYHKKYSVGKNIGLGIGIAFGVAAAVMTPLVIRGVEDMD